MTSFAPDADPADPVAAAAAVEPEVIEPAPAEPEAAVDLDAIERELAAVDQALTRLDDGTYGTCQVCQGPLDDALLAVDPTISVCPAHLDVVGH